MVLNSLGKSRQGIARPLINCDASGWRGLLACEGSTPVPGCGAWRPRRAPSLIAIRRMGSADEAIILIAKTHGRAVTGLIAKAVRRGRRTTTRETRVLPEPDRGAIKVICKSNQSVTAQRSFGKSFENRSNRHANALGGIGSLTSTVLLNKERKL